MSFPASAVNSSSEFPVSNYQNVSFNYPINVSFLSNISKLDTLAVEIFIPYDEINPKVVWVLPPREADWILDTRDKIWCIINSDFNKTRGVIVCI